MFETLLASAPGLSQPIGPRLLAAGVHAGLIAAAVVGTTRVPVHVAPTRVDTIDLGVPEPSQPSQPLPPRSPVFPSAPVLEPVGEPILPDLDLPGTIQPASPVDLRTMLTGDLKRPVAPLGDGLLSTPKGEAILLAAEVDEPVTVLRQGIPKYPRVLEGLGVSGRVVLEFVVDTTGAVEPNSLRVVLSSAPGFEAAALEAVRATQFSPARARGRLVRQLASQAVNFTAR